MPEPDRDLALLTDAAHAAGALALGYFRHKPQVWEKPDDAGPVSAADLAVDAMLRETLGAARPDAGWLSEETADNSARLGHDEVFIVDPIDGTRAFVAEDPAWAVSLALVRGGRPAAAVVYLPVEGLLYTATADGPARLNGATIRVAPSHHAAADPLAGARVLTAARMLQPALWPGGVPPISRHFRPSLAWRLALVAEGRFDAMLTLRDAWEWDIAAGCLIAARAGAEVSDRNGHLPHFNNPIPQVPGLIAAGPVTHSALLARLHPATGAHRAESV